ncbi:MAG: TonB-system energizer ExbB [Campylobacteraceae bacterium 4484_4]|nr:MAG: TonB-system energizer ExbB [Campylobacteraceae bacterium 4484_4]
MNITLLQNLVDYGIIGLLFLLSILSVWLFIERKLFYRSLDFTAYKSKKKFEIALTKNLTTIATIASNAPYIGLLGTVVAIMITFFTMGEAGMDAAKITAALALALKTTAAGLVVAIISIVFYNILARDTERLLVEYEER